MFRIPSPDVASVLLLGAVVAAILPPGYSAYSGAYVALAASMVALLFFGWDERSTFQHPTAQAIVVSMALVALSVPFVYRGERDLLAPVLMLPMLAAVALGLLARPAAWVARPATFALICLAASFLALLGGAYEHFVLGISRPGLGNNPIHYSSLAVMAGCLALVGVAASVSPWRYLFLFGPLFAIGSAGVAESRGPLAGGIAMTCVGMMVLLIWFWRETAFRMATLAGAAVAALGLGYLTAVGDSRIAGLIESGLALFRFTGGNDDVRAAFYASAVEVMKQSPLVGVGLGQIMLAAETTFPDIVAGTGFENLHADWANFAVMAGAMGLIAWLLLLAAPLLLLVETRVRQNRAIVLGAILLSTGQLILGISNATFGILPQTAMYAVALGYFLVLARRLALGYPARR